jgi:hypothetical protein
MVRSVSAAGYVPLVKYVDYNWADPRTPEQMADYMSRTYFSGDENREELTQKMQRLAKQHAGADGNVIDNVNTRVAWIYWGTGEHT